MVRELLKIYRHPQILPQHFKMLPNIPEDIRDFLKQHVSEINSCEGSGYKLIYNLVAFLRY